MHLEKQNLSPGVQHRQGSPQLGSSSVGRSLALLVDSAPSECPVCSCSTEREQILGGSNKGLTSRDEVLIPPHTVLVRPHLQFCVQFWLLVDVDRLERPHKGDHRAGKPGT